MIQQESIEDVHNVEELFDTPKAQGSKLLLLPKQGARQDSE